MSNMSFIHNICCFVLCKTKRWINKFPSSERDPRLQMIQFGIQSNKENETIMFMTPQNQVFLPPQQSTSVPYPQMPRQFAPQYYVPPNMYPNCQLQPPMMFYPGAQMEVKA